MTTDTSGSQTVVTDNGDRFIINYHGQKAGFTEYVDHEGQRIFPHTEIDKEFGGRGLATVLVGEALETTRAAGLRIVPVCSMVAHYIEEHPEFNDIVDPITTDIKRVLSRH